MTKQDNIETALRYENRADRTVIDWFTDRGYTITRRDDLDRIDYNVTHDDKEVLLEVKTRDCNSYDYPTAWIRQDKVDAMDRISVTEGKPAYLMYIYLGDNRFFISDIEELKTYSTVTNQVYNPIKLNQVETNVEIPLKEKKFYNF